MHLDFTSDQNEEVPRRTPLLDDHRMLLDRLLREEGEDARDDRAGLTQVAEDGVQMTGPEEVSLHPLVIVLSLAAQSLVGREVQCQHFDLGDGYDGRFA